MLGKLGIESEFRAGLRVTTPEVLDVARMVLTGQVQRELVNLINHHGPYAVGVSGEDASLFEATQFFPVNDGEQIDVGLVGEVTSVRADIVQTLIADGLILWCRALSRRRRHDLQHQRGHCSCRTVRGPDRGKASDDDRRTRSVCANWPASEEVISELSRADLAALLPQLAGGMIPKMQACLTAVEGGVARAHVIDGRLEHSVLLEIFTDSGIGTMVYADAHGERDD